MPCNIHRSQKLGKCKCGAWKCCPPNPNCVNHKKKEKRIIPNHIGTLPKRIRKQLNTTSDVNNAGAEGSILVYQNTWDAHRKKSPDIIAQIIREVKNIPDGGYDPVQLAKKDTTYKKAKELYTLVVNLIQRAMFPSNSDLAVLFEDKVDTNDDLFHNTCDLFLHGDNITSKICASLLATSCSYTNINESIETSINVLPLKKLSKLGGHRKAFGYARVRLGKKHFKGLYMGKSPFNKVYKCRLKPDNLATSMKYFQEQCPIIPGMTRNAKIDGREF